MLDLTFGEQVKIILSRKGMTIKELAEIIEERTGKKMSRQNLTQRLGRDNFQEQDMRMIAEILECPFQLSILGETRPEEEKESRQAVPTEAELTLLTKKRKKKRIPTERDITIGELMDIHQDLDELQDSCSEEEVAEAVAEVTEGSAELEICVEVAEGPKQEVSLETEMEEPDQESGGETEKELEADLATAETPETDQEQSVEEPQEELQAASRQEHAKPAKKQRGSWRDFFQRRVKKEETALEQAEEKEEIVQEAPEETLAVEQKEVVIEENIPVEFEIENSHAEEEMVLSEDPEEEDLERGDVNPYTGHEYETNTVRIHPKRIGYVQVYDRSNHQWTDMTEWAFLGYQERKKALLGNDYEPPIYLD